MSNLMRLYLPFLLLFIAWSACAETLAGHVVAVSDGDTITVLDASKQQHKIRLAGIDAPEQKQAFGQRAKQKLSYLVFDKAVVVDWSKADKYKRKVGKVLLRPDYCPGAGCPFVRDANIEMLTAGLAWHYKEYEREQSEEDRGRYAIAEEEARAGRVGLWRDPNPEAPWDWRKRFKAERLRRAAQ